MAPKEAPKHLDGIPYSRGSKNIQQSRRIGDHKTSGASLAKGMPRGTLIER